MYLHFSKKDAIDEIALEGKLNYKWNFRVINENQHFSLGQFKKINLFVGSNNSGKSRFLRSIIKSNFTNQIYLSKSKITFPQHLTKYNSEYAELYNRIRNYPQVSEFLNKIKNSIPNDIYYKISQKETFSQIILKEITTQTERLKTTNRISKAIKTLILNFYDETKQLISHSNFIIDNLYRNKKYIPILRSIHEVNGHLNQGNLKRVVEENYGIKENIYTGLELYTTILNLKNSTAINRQKVKKFENFLSKNFFNNKIVELTSNSKKSELLFSVGKEEYPIYHLGDGIQSLIILLFPIFTAENDDWFFIEEPETNLHPGLQRVFIETLLNDEYLKSTNLKYFFTTHSNHFLDTSIQNNNISIFQFEKKEDETFSIKANVKPEKEILDILGVNTSSVFLANTSLWVEGPTDRKYISKFLKLYCKHKDLQPLKEDIDFAFFEYGGNLIEHYLFDDYEEFNEEDVREKINSFSLSNKIFLLADNDNAKRGSKKDLRRIALLELSNENENFNYQNTKLKEIENLLPKKVIQEFMKELIYKEENQEKSQKIKFKRDDYKNTGLGDFYTEKFKNFINSKHLKSFKASSGTLKNDYKIKLASFVVDSDYTYLDLIEDNKELESLIENLYKFIIK